MPPVPSQPPEGVQATPLSSDSVKVAWSPPPLFTLHGILQGYKILYKPVRLDEDESDANFQTSPHLEIVLFGLEKFTNYSVQVLAYTRKGEGVRSAPVYVTTQEDVPDAPARIKALATNDSAILISWMPPARPNGVIKGYTLYFNNQSSPEVEDVPIPLPSDSTYYMMGGLPRGVEFAFRCSASTTMGEGRSTKYISTSTLVVAPARIASFPVTVTQAWHEDVTFPCVTVGSPAPVVTWRLRNRRVQNSPRTRILKNGYLVVSSVTGSDAANYTCHAENPHGRSQITYTLKVQAPPHPPHLYLVMTTTSTIQVNWLSGSNGGSPIQGFVLNYKMDHQGWQSLSMGPTNRTFIANNLRCGTSYKFSLRARNKLGDSLDSEMVTASTNGSGKLRRAWALGVWGSGVGNSLDSEMVTASTNGSGRLRRAWALGVWGSVGNSLDSEMVTASTDVSG
ncbi:down syndrome cell adhesion molecule [Elysia marginata]|uniref:Down syndrome cell adhesion molecule n=1 Tax=Elysia marginata TaxID=1093978 RepID=A0AAV4FNL1_9GAST|nr:down syndrome cell adhesion molecule [Elysia marginata]